MYKCEGIGCDRSFSSKIGKGLHHNKCKFYQKKEINVSNFEFTCICGKKFERKPQLKGHAAKCKISLDYIKSYKDLITKEYLYEMYFINGLSAYQISKTLNYPGVGAGYIIHLLKEFGYETRNIQDAAKMDSCRTLYKETCLEKYGDINVLGKNSYKFHERNNTVIEKYGVSNVFQSKEIKDKITNTIFEKYGVLNAVSIPGRYTNPGRKSKPHIIVESLLNELSIDFTSEDNTYDFTVDGYNPRPDIIISSLNVVIEINGDYWHGNPLKYKENDIIHKWGGAIMVKEIWEYDKKRNNQIESFGFKVIVLWESDIKELNSEKLWKILELNQLKN